MKTIKTFENLLVDGKDMDHAIRVAAELKGFSHKDIFGITAQIQENRQWLISFKVRVEETEVTPEVKKEVKHLKSYKFNKKEITVLHNLISDVTSDIITIKKAFKEIEGYCKNENKLNIFKMVIDNFTNKNNYHSGSRINFKGGTKVYYDINNPEEAYNKALNDDFVSHKETIEVNPYYPSDFYKSSELIKNYLISINQKAA